MATTDDTKKQVKAVLDEMRVYSDEGDIPKDKLLDSLIRLIELGESELVYEALLRAAPEQFLNACNQVQTLQAR